MFQDSSQIERNGPRPLPSNRRTSAFERRVGKTLRALHVNGREGEPVIVAVSGGADSLATLVATARALPARVTAAHFDHRLRTSAEAERDLQAVSVVVDALVTEGLEVGLAHGRAPKRPADRSEAGAREARYRWLARACREAGARVVLTGHTLDDQAETVLLRLARGAGALGASGMRPVASWPVEVRGSRGLQVMRPLIEVTRAEVEGYLDALGVTPSHDATNDMLDYARNRVRHVVLPALRALNSRASEHLAEFAALQREDHDALEEFAEAWIAEHTNTCSTSGERFVTIMLASLRELPIALQARVVRGAAESVGVELERRHVQAILGSLEKNGASVDLPLARSRTSGSLLELRTQTSHPGTE